MSDSAFTLEEVAELRQHAPDPRTLPVIWYGAYDEDFEKVDGEWKIKGCELQFLWLERLVSEDFPRPLT